MNHSPLQEILMTNFKTLAALMMTALMAAGTASAATVRLDPSWKITTDTGYYLVNGITGAVTTGTA